MVKLGCAKFYFKLAVKYSSILLFFIFSGCSQNISNFTLVSTKPTDLSVKYESIGQIEGSDVSHIIIIIPTKLAPRIDKAVNNALSNNNADYLTNAIVKSESFYIPYVYGFNRFKVTGEGWKLPIDTTDKLENDKLENDLLILQSGKEHRVNYISKDEKGITFFVNGATQSQTLPYSLILKLVLENGDIIFESGNENGELFLGKEKTTKNQTSNKIIRYNPETGEPIYN